MILSSRIQSAYRYLEIHHFLCERAHFIVQAKPVFSNLFCREHRIHLSLNLISHDSFAIWSYNVVIYIEGAACLHLYAYVSQTWTPVAKTHEQEFQNCLTYSEVESYLCSLLLYLSEEAGFLVRGELVGQSCRRSKRRQIGYDAYKRQEQSIHSALKQLIIRRYPMRGVCSSPGSQIESAKKKLGRIAPEFEARSGAAALARSYLP